MLCEKCQKRPAVVHFAQIVNNQKTEMHLCEVCAGELQAQSHIFSPQFNLQNFLSGLLTSDFGGTLSPTGTQKCESCGMPEENFIRSGLLGCSNCYSSFGNRLKNVLKRIQGTNTHTGKVPHRIGGKALINKEIRTLKARLEKAVLNEDFENAALIRDNIRELEKKLKG